MVAMGLPRWRALILLALLPLAGCAHYWRDRARDFADPVGLRFIGSGLGASVRATHFVQAGLLGVFSVEGHNPGIMGRKCRLGAPPYQAFEAGLAPLAYLRRADGEARAIVLGRSFLAGGAGTEESPAPGRWTFLPGRKLYSGGYDRRLFDFGAGVYLFLGLDLSFNPAELLDLILGFTGLDLLGDDGEAEPGG
jgi:hypothetical protein